MLLRVRGRVREREERRSLIVDILSSMDARESEGWLKSEKELLNQLDDAELFSRGLGGAFNLWQHLMMFSFR
jgi:hypothetical protein